MNKPNTVIGWLEEKTGEPIGEMIAALNRPEPPPESDRHLSVRLPFDLADRLKGYAEHRGQTVSQAIRAMVEEALGHAESARGLDDRQLTDQLDATIAEVKRRLAG